MIDKDCVFLVGGAVRDILLGLEPKDKDYVVINYSESDMLSLGFEKVGKDFPVFLHPETGYEYALARRERKNGNGYNGFSVETDNVSLEEDLFRRDLTINSMAMNYKMELVDPYKGKYDLENKILKHVSKHFAEDPLRILRTARFSARYNYDIHNSTLNMMSLMIENGEFDHLTPERIWKEFDKVLGEKHLINFFHILEKIGANQKLFNINQFEDIDFLKKIENSNHSNYELKASFLFSQLNKNLLTELKIPNEVQQLAKNFQSVNKTNWLYSELTPEEKIKFIHSNRSLQNPDNTVNTIKYISVYQNWKNNSSVDEQYEISSFLSDIRLLKQINYPIIVQEAKDNKINVNQYVLETQIKQISNGHKNKLRI